MTERPDIARAPTVPLGNLRADPRAAMPPRPGLPPGARPASPRGPIASPAQAAAEGAAGPVATAGPIPGLAASPGGLLRSTLKAAGVAGAILVLVYLPAEYGVDPTGLGSVLGLTEMGQIKQQLYAEAAAEEALARSPAAAPALPREILARLEGIEASIAALAVTVGATPPLPPAAAPAAEPPPAAPSAAPEATAASAAATASATAEPAPAATEAEPEASAPLPSEPASIEWRDEYQVTLAPGEGIEVKLVMEEGQTATFAWSAGGGVLNHDTHGDGGGQSVSYEEGRAVPGQEGTLTAAFTGNHGWFWRNRTDTPVTLTLRTGGDYAEMRQP